VGIVWGAAAGNEEDPGGAMTEATDEAEATPTEEPEGPKNTSFALGHKAKFCGFDVTATKPSSAAST